MPLPWCKQLTNPIRQVKTLLISATLFSSITSFQIYAAQVARSRALLMDCHMYELSLRQKFPVCTEWYGWKHNGNYHWICMDILSGGAGYVTGTICCLRLRSNCNFLCLNLLPFWFGCFVCFFCRFKCSNWFLNLTIAVIQGWHSTPQLQYI